MDFIDRIRDLGEKALSLHPEDLYQYADRLKATVARYDDPSEPVEVAEDDDN